jgi:hypothetical protein
MNRVSTRRKKVREPGGGSPKENKVFTTWFRTGVRDDGGLGHILIGTNETFEKDIMSSPRCRERSGESRTNECSARRCAHAQ